MSTLVYQIALTMTPQIGCVHARLLLEHFGDAASVFKARKIDLSRVEGIGTVRAEAIKTFNDFERAEAECRFIEENDIQPLVIGQPGYPTRLLNCYDPPAILYYKGHADLNHPRIVAIVGTRICSDYGRQVTEQLVSGMKDQQVLVLSGLAYGIDAWAHKAALKLQMPTVGVLAHGLDTLYPQQHTQLAKEILWKNGGLLTEFRSGTEPDKHNFPARNRVVAGMADAVVVVETDTRGGSMITASLAHGYNRDVFAFPGRAADAKSAGCNQLIKSNKAALVTDASDIVDVMGWTSNSTAKKAVRQRELFIELDDGERTVVNILNDADILHVDDIYQRSGFNSSTVATAILTLELKNVVQSLPGKMYRLA